MSEPTPPNCPTCLLDLPDLLSLDGFDACLWKLLDCQARRCCKLTCRAGRQLVDSLVASTSLCDDRKPAPADDLGEEASSQKAWRLAVAAHTALLPRLPRLTSLSVCAAWPTEVDLYKALPLYGPATGGRLIRLDLRGGGQLSHAGVLAAWRACPQLQHLLLSPHSSRHEICHLHGALFLPLHDSLLTQLTLERCSLTDDALASLSGLSSLTSLTMNCTRGETYTQDLRHVTGLLNLRHCDISFSCNRARDQPCLLDAAGLLASTQLTSLRLTDADAVSRYKDSAPWVAAALSLLGGLALLQSLDLGPHFVVDGAVLSALGRLTQLTRLCVGEIAPEAPTRKGYLPLLKMLCLGDKHEGLDPECLLQSLTPLLPLPSLATLHERYWAMKINANGGANGAAAAAAAVAAAAVVSQLAALKSTVQHLAAAPMLPPPTKLRITVRALGCLSLARMVDSLHPLGQHLRCFSCVGINVVGADWSAVHRCMPCLEELSLQPYDCCTVDLDAAAIVRHLTSLTVLKIYCCNVAPGTWYRLAEERARPLQLLSTCMPSAQVVALCRAHQDRLYGVQNIEWLL